MTEYKVVITETRSYFVHADSAESATWKAIALNEKGCETEYVKIEEVRECGTYDRWQCEACPWVEGCEPPYCAEGLR